MKGHHQYTCGGTKVKVIGQGQGQILRPQRSMLFKKRPFWGAYVFQKHTFFFFLIDCSKWRRPWKSRLLKTLWEKEKMLVTSILSFYHHDFYPKHILIFKSYLFSCLKMHSISTGWNCCRLVKSLIIIIFSLPSVLTFLFPSGHVWWRILDRRIKKCW